jgi:hypothetical protein
MLNYAINAFIKPNREIIMKPIFTILFLLVCVQATLAQPSPDTLWTRTYGGSNEDRARAVQPTAEGGYVIAGWTWSFGAGFYDFYLVKTNSQGDTLWSRTYGGSSYDVAASVQETDSGGYIIAGYTNSFGAGTPTYTNIWLVRTDSQGDTIWTSTYGGNSSDEASSVQQTSDRGYIVAGNTLSYGAGGADYYLVRVSSQGDSLWKKTYGGSGDEYAYCVRQMDDDGYIIAGTTRSFGVGTPTYTNIWLVRTNSGGDTLWTRTYGGSSGEAASCVQPTTDGGYIVVGSTYSFGAGQWDFYLVKTDFQGDTLWTRTYGGSNMDWAYSVQQTADGGYIVAGNTASSGEGSYDFYLVKTNSQGAMVWTRTYGGSNSDGAYSVRQTSDGGYIIAGETNSLGAGNMDFYLVKTGPELAVEPPAVSLPNEYALFQNYPNPFNPVTTIQYNVSGTGFVSLKVFNPLGQEVVTLVQGIVPAGSHAVAWDATNLPSGIYFLRMNAGEFVQTRKMVLLK